jgi:hypothetical protein
MGQKKILFVNLENAFVGRDILELVASLKKWELT